MVRACKHRRAILLQLSVIAHRDASADPVTHTCAGTTGAARMCHMTNKPLNYDDITRRTVVGPDGSFRPTREEEDAAYRGFRATTPEEQALHGRAMAALAGMALGGPDLSHLKIEIEDETAILLGEAPDMHTIEAIETRIREVPGIAKVKNELVVRAA
jgi:hypothetical protein